MTYGINSCDIGPSGFQTECSGQRVDERTSRRWRTQRGVCRGKKTHGIAAERNDSRRDGCWCVDDKRRRRRARSAKWPRVRRRTPHCLTSTCVRDAGGDEPNQRAFVGPAHLVARFSERHEPEKASEPSAGSLPDVAYAITRGRCPPVRLIENLLTPIVMNRVHRETLGGSGIDAQRGEAIAHEPRDVCGVER